MKKALMFLCSLLLVLLCACGGSGGQPSGSLPPSSAPTPSQSAPAPTDDPTPTPTGEPSPQPSQEPPAASGGAVNPLTGLPMDESLAGQKPVAIMLNNIKAAMPQQGNSQADIIYEVLAEGGITRMLGVYQDISGLGTVGSVRSARQYYLELAMGHDAVFVHAGGSPEFYDYIQTNKVGTVDGVNGFYAYASTGLFWRDRERVDGHYYAYEHSLITSGDRLTAVLTKQGELTGHTAGYTSPLTFSDQRSTVGGGSAVTLTVPFSGSKTTTFRYDAEAGHYLAQQYGGPYIDGNDNTQISAVNVLVLQAETRVVDDAGRLKIDLSSGEGWYACGGELIPISWIKGGANDPLRFTHADGSPLTLSPGKSYVCIIPATREITAE